MSFCAQRSKCLLSKEAKLFFFLFHFSCKGCKSVQGEMTVEGLAALTSGAGRKLSKTRFIVVCKNTVPSRSSTHVCSEVIKWPPKEETLYCFCRCVTDRAALQCAQRSPEWFFNPSASTKVKKPQ